MSESAASDTGPLDFNAAVSLLEANEEQEQTPESPDEGAGDQEIDAETSSADDDAGEPEKPESEDVEEEQEQAETQLEAPLYWSKEAKAKFAELPPELQAVVLSQEGPREEVTAKVKAEAKAQIEAAQKEVESIQKLAVSLNAFLPQAVQTFQSRWGEAEPDWDRVAEEQGTDVAFRLKTQHDKEKAYLAQLNESNRQAQEEAHKAFVQSEWKVLAELSPDLAPDVADAQKGYEKRESVTKYLVGQGIPVEAVRQISAREMVLAHKAMLWDQAQAQLKAKPATPKPTSPPPKAAVRPAAAPVQTKTQQLATTASNRFAQTRSVEDAIAFLEAKGGR